jgi:site-specific DNA-methyltransferase (adenine-specific)
MVFADPPDNIGLDYDSDEHADSIPPRAYAHRLRLWMRSLFAWPDTVVWLSVNAKHMPTVYSEWAAQKEYGDEREIRMIAWYFTFGQHRHSDLGSNYRPLFRFARDNHQWNTDDIRIPSKRQQMGDKRADPRGRVPGDVWGGPSDIPGLCRVQGNNRQRRAWHPTQHPEGIVERAIRISTQPGDLIVDPFCGTGTTLRTCQRIDRCCITIDISETYCRNVSRETGVPVNDAPLFAGLEGDER